MPGQLPGVRASTSPTAGRRRSPGSCRGRSVNACRVASRGPRAGRAAAPACRPARRPASGSRCSPTRRGAGRGPWWARRRPARCAGCRACSCVMIVNGVTPARRSLVRERRARRARRERAGRDPAAALAWSRNRSDGRSSRRSADLVPDWGSDSDRLGGAVAELADLVVAPAGERRRRSGSRRCAASPRRSAATGRRPAPSPRSGSVGEAVARPAGRAGRSGCRPSTTGWPALSTPQVEPSPVVTWVQIWSPVTGTGRVRSWWCAVAELALAVEAPAQHPPGLGDPAGLGPGRAQLEPRRCRRRPRSGALRVVVVPSPTSPKSF